MPRNKDAAMYGKMRAKIREVETWTCRTAQAVKVRHPRTEIWRERNSRTVAWLGGRVANDAAYGCGRVSKCFTWRVIESKFRESRIHPLCKGQVYVLMVISSKMLREEQI